MSMEKPPRPNGRKANELRPLRIKRRYTGQAPGSVLIRMGRTTVLCTCCIELSVPPFLEGSGKGWLSAEYGMLPGSTNTRKQRDRAGKVDGRSVEIQRLIGRSLRAVVNLDKLGERTLWIDCDVLEAVGGTRTASINGAFVAVIDALHSIKGLNCPIQEIVRDSVAAISVGLLHDVELLDLEYVEDRDAEVDLNLVMTGSGQFIEVQGTGEESTFSRTQLDRLLKLGKHGIDRLTVHQKKALGTSWPFS
jgi:ribonuclease PH